MVDGSLGGWAVGGALKVVVGKRLAGRGGGGDRDAVGTRRWSGRGRDVDVFCSEAALHCGVSAFVYRAAMVSVREYRLQLSHGHAHAQNNLLWCFSRRLDLTWGGVRGGGFVFVDCMLDRGMQSFNSQ